MTALPRAFLVAGLAAGLVASPATASDPTVLAARYGPALERCYAEGGVLAACKGRLSDPCMETEVGGYSTTGMVFCMQAETLVWDAHLNAEYRLSMDWAGAMDAADSLFPGFARRAEALRSAQRAWIAFRDAQCRLDYAVWGGGSMRMIAGAACEMEMTADRAIALRALREGFE
ncbi:MAG: DUF1311 domain-containing protein [Paracoccaceae bacterium]|nr:DUF1311 domain-containing protein [Paracoccaceae bacterium]